MDWQQPTNQPSKRNRLVTANHPKTQLSIQVVDYRATELSVKIFSHTSRDLAAIKHIAGYYHKGDLFLLVPYLNEPPIAEAK